MKPVVYILEGNRFYVGSTSDIERRLKEHRNGKTHTTKRLGDWDLVKVIECESLEDARRLEREIKKSKNVRRWI